MRIFVTGDVHGGADYGLEKFSSRNFQEGKSLTKDDYMIVSGDFGLLWDPAANITKEEKHNLDWLSGKPWTTLFIDGNHENFTRLDALSTVEMFGAPVGKVNDSVYHLRRGYVYNIGGLKFFTFGGGLSIDKNNRMPYVSWWPREIPNYEEMSRGLANLQAAGNKVDYIIAHDGPDCVIPHMVSHHDQPYQLTWYLQQIVDDVEFKHYYFGHHHDNKTVLEKFTCLYHGIREIK